MHGRLLIYFPFCWLATLFTTIRNKETIHQKGYFCFFGGVLITDFVKWQEKKKRAQFPSHIERCSFSLTRLMTDMLSVK